VRAPSIDIGRGAVLAGRYQIEAVIGKGGSGVVLRAFDRVTQGLVAVKILNPAFAQDPRWVERFSRELRLGRQMQHPHVCRVFDIGEADGHWFLTMELAGKGTLRSSVGAAAAERPLDDRLADARAAIAGLAALHGAGIVHRDVKPDNFLRMDDGRLVLSDFGLATNSSDPTMFTVMVGTPSYMAPEVVLGEPATARSDVWSLGVVMHELVFGERPSFEATDRGHRLRVPAARKLSRVERAVVALCAACLVENAARRPTNAQELVARFEQALRGRIARTARPVIDQWPRWAAPAIIVGVLVAWTAVRGRWWTSAAASSALPVHSNAIVEPTGVALDWKQRGHTLASFEEKVHCLSWVDGARALRVVVGSPRRAIDIDATTKARRPSPLASETYAVGCPQQSKRGSVLFERFDEEGRRQIMLSQDEREEHSARRIAEGADPLWLPNGDEFVFDVDGAHAAVFSLPSMTSSLVSGDAPPSSFLVDKAVSADGSSLALRYMDQWSHKHVRTYALPSLQLADSMTFKSGVLGLAYWGDRARLLVAWSASGGSTLAEVDFRAHGARRWAIVSDRDIGLPVASGGEIAFKTVRYRGNVWRVRDGQLGERLTDDGFTMGADLSPNGDLISEHVGNDGTVALQYIPKGSSPRIVTAGPSDFSPQFLPDGSGWLYVDGEARAIRRCTLGRCETVHAAADYPYFPTASPDTKLIAYVTKVNRERLMVLESDGGTRDLGPALSDCAPRWSSSHLLWVLRGTNRDPRWVEVNADTGEKTGRSASPGPRLDSVRDCPFVLDPPGTLHPLGVVTKSWEDNDVRVISED
jgi:serine/threonine-protein kinase